MHRVGAHEVLGLVQGGVELPQVSVTVGQLLPDAPHILDVAEELLEEVDHILIAPLPLEIAGQRSDIDHGVAAAGDAALIFDGLVDVAGAGVGIA
jgi:hypothetical protein